MAHYAIGDLQGCFDELKTLLAAIGFNHGTDTLWLTGDLVNRGPKSWECLQFVRKHPDSVQTVLGNHDLHLLAIAYGHGKLKKNDTLAPVLTHNKFSKVCDWLRTQPLLIQQKQHILVHAGILPQWTIPQATEYADEIQTALRNKHPEKFFAHMYGNNPIIWSEQLQGNERLRFITNVFTRMRVLIKHNGALDLDFKSTYSDIPSDRCAWFDAPNRQHHGYTIVFGHWSALGLHQNTDTLALDTGALWGGMLTAANLDTGEITQIQSQNHTDWRKI